MTPDYDSAARDALYDPPDLVDPQECPECGCEAMDWNGRKDRWECRCLIYKGECFDGDVAPPMAEPCGGTVHICSSRECCR